MPLTIHYHRDFDGICSAALLAWCLREHFGRSDLRWRGINYDRRRDWRAFGEGEEFAIVDFHFHPAAAYWFDHHPTTFLDEDLRAAYRESDRWRFDPSALSCPPVILRQARERWGTSPPERFDEIGRWSDRIDAARYPSVEDALFGDVPAYRLVRALTVAPHADWSDVLVERLIDRDLAETAGDPAIEKMHARACRNRDRALAEFPQTVLSTDAGVVLYDASSDRIRRERFAPFYHHPEAVYAVGVIPTRSGFHVTAGENPWNAPAVRANVGALCERFGGGGHAGVGGANPPSLEEAKRVAGEIAAALRRDVAAPR
ncbi:MAG: hypothetical protein L0323_00580 [Planctomycetes bacterium]|nr:hypothetical protein [Planctomycetota bacterium]